MVPKLDIYIHLHRERIKEEWQPAPEHPAHSAFAGVVTSSTDAGVFTLFFKGFVVRGARLHPRVCLFRNLITIEMF
jgi:hypothetical protein